MVPTCVHTHTKSHMHERRRDLGSGQRAMLGKETGKINMPTNFGIFNGCQIGWGGGEGARRISVEM